MSQEQAVSPTISETIEKSYFPLKIRMSEATRYQYRIALRNFEHFLGRTATIDDLNDDTITLWMGGLLAQGLSAATVAERGRRLGTLWTWLAKRGRKTTFPTFEKPEIPDNCPLALSREQIRSLLASAGRERGTIGQVPAWLWWPSFLSFVWMSAERKSAAMAVRIEWIDLCKRTVVIPPGVRKGKKKWGRYTIMPQAVPLFQQTIDVCPDRELMWPWDRCHESYYKDFNRILKDAGIPVCRKTKTHGLRVSHATHLKVAGGDPTRSLMHSDIATTMKHYIDQSKLPQEESRLWWPIDGQAG